MRKESIPPRFRGAGRKQIQKQVNDITSFDIFFSPIEPELSEYQECPVTCLRCSIEDLKAERKHRRRRGF